MNIDSLSIDKIKDTIINKILNDLVISEQLTDAAKVLKRKELEQLIKAKDLITQLRFQQGLTDAVGITQTMQEFYIDILTAFGCINTLDQIVDSRLSLNQSTINNLKSQVNSTNDSIDAYEAELSAMGNPCHIIEGFRNANSFENNQDYYTERYGELVPLSCRVNYDAYEENIGMPYLRNENTFLYDNGVSLGHVSINRQLGGGFMKINNDQNSLDNIIDSSMQSYWSQSILCDEPIGVDFAPTRPIDPLALKDYYYGVNFGALCELDFVYESIAVINEITLMPYGQYPMEIVAIRYKTTDDPLEPLKEIVYPGNPNTSLRNKIITETTSYRFPEVTVKNVYIVLNQIHYTRNTFIYSSDEVFKNEMWFTLTNPVNDKPVINSDLMYNPMYIDRAIDDPSWSFINSLVAKDKYIDLKGILFDSKNTNTTVIKYQYTYGFYNVSLNYNDFEDTGVYISKPIEVDGNVKSIAITVDESHPVLDNGDVWTDIEYYITWQGQPQYTDWIPIYPKNKNTILSELLQLGDIPEWYSPTEVITLVDPGICFLRFPAEAIYQILINEIPMVETLDYELHKFTNDNTKYANMIYAVDIPNFDPFSKYTVNYKPYESSKELDLISNDNPAIVSSVESYNGNNASYFQLANYPYNYSDGRVSTYVRIIDKNTGKILLQEEGDIVCITDAFSSSESYKGIIGNSSKYQYYTDSNYLYFNQNIADNFIVEISYTHYVSSVRLKAIFRKNSLKYDWMAAVINKIDYEFVTID